MLLFCATMPAAAKFLRRPPLDRTRYRRHHRPTRSHAPAAGVFVTRRTAPRSRSAASARPGYLRPHPPLDSNGRLDFLSICGAGPPPLRHDAGSGEIPALITARPPAQPPQTLATSVALTRSTAHRLPAAPAQAQDTRPRALPSTETCVWNSYPSWVPQLSGLQGLPLGEL